MKALCFALILNALNEGPESAAPPIHIQELLKKRILFQLKQKDPNLNFFFDDASCNVVGTYQYTDDSVQIVNNDKSLDLSIPYNDILEGKKLELSQVSQSIETKANIVALSASTVTPSKSLLEANKFDSEFTSEKPREASQFKKWLPWIVGAVGLSVGGIIVYNALEKQSGGGSSGEEAKRRRR
jgi:hypothetical protein